ncbi:MAG: sigma-70 family RNA polymerase sigma factor [Vicinamibacterales bacterium]
MTTDDRPSSFPATRLSVVARTRSRDEAERRIAFETLIGAYWKPVYKYLRLKWRFDPDEAADLTQEFFQGTLEKTVIERYDPGRARFRTYLRLCLDGVASNHRKAGARLKRGGGTTIVPLDFTTAEGEVRQHEPAVTDDVEALFYREWVRALVERAVDDLRAWAASTGRSRMFDVFARYDLADDDARPTYAAIGADLGLTATTVTNHLAAMRRQLRRCLLERLREITASDDEFEAEARRLLGGGP